MTTAAASPFVMLPLVELDAVGADPSLLAVWTALRRWASRKARSQAFAGRTFYLARGQLVTTQLALVRLTGVSSRSVLRRCLATLLRLGWIETTTSDEATVVTVRGAAAEPARRSANPSRSGSLEPQDVPDAEDPDRPGLEPRKQIEEQQINSNPTLPFARAYASEGGRGFDRVEWEEPPEPPNEAAAAGPPPGSDDGPCHGTELYPELPPQTTRPPPPLPPPPLSPDEVELLRFAQTRLARIASQREAGALVDTWRQCPWVTLEALRGAFDWIASHPVARRDTRRFTRAFHVDEARHSYRDWDARIRAIVTAELTGGRAAEDVASALAAHTPSFDANVMRAYVLRVAAEVAAGLRSQEARS